MDQLWLFPAAPALAFILDLLLGDPCRLPHPVRLIVRCIRVLELFLRSFLKGLWVERAGGVLLMLLVAGMAALKGMFQ